LPSEAAAARHLEQSAPREWRTVEIGGEVLVLKSGPEARLPRAYRVAGTTTNPRAIALHDACLYEGNVLEPHYFQPHKAVELHHDYAGQMADLLVDEWLDEPVVLLAELDRAGEGALAEVLHR
jgi:hypothetical protein